MKLIEKKCPNCGAALEFNESDKSCKCEYCHRSFEIERDQSVDVSDIAEQFNLNELKTPMKIFASFMIGNYIISAIITIIAFVAIGFIAYSISKNFNGGNTYYNNVEQFSNEDYGNFDDKAFSTIHKNDDNLDDYSLEMNVKREKVYLLYNEKDKKNIIYTVYKASYSNFPDKNKVFVYVPIKYENLKNNNSFLIFQLDNGKVEAPEFYLNEEKTEFTYGYSDIESFEKDVINKIGSNYKVTKK